MTDIDMAILEDVDEDIRSVATPLVERRERVIAHRAQLIEAREQADEVLRRLDRVLKPLRPDLYTSAPKPKPRTNGGQKRVGTRMATGTATGHGITVEAVGPYVAEIKRQIGDGDGHVTQMGVYGKVKGGEQGKSSAAFRYLRDIGFLRKGGMIDRREAWYIDNPDAYDKAVKELENNA